MLFARPGRGEHDFGDVAEGRIDIPDALNLIERAGSKAEIVGLTIGECQVFCVWLIGSMLPERSKDDDDFQRTAGRVAEGLQAA